MGAVEALAQQQQPRGQQEGFQRPAQERRIEAGEDDDEVRRRPVRTPQLPESIEDRLYFRERPGGSGGDEESVRHRELERLLRDREQLVRARRTQAITLLVEF